MVYSVFWRGLCSCVCVLGVRGEGYCRGCVCELGGGLYKVRSDHHAPLLSRGIGNEVFLVSVDIRKKKGADRASATPKCQPVTE